MVKSHVKSRPNAATSSQDGSVSKKPRPAAAFEPSSISSDPRNVKAANEPPLVVDTMRLEYFICEALPRNIREKLPEHLSGPPDR